MPIPTFNTIITHGISSIPNISTIIKTIVSLLILYILKRYFAGASNTSERVLHGKVAIITGGTSGIGAAVARELATRGAQLVLLSRHPLSDPFLVDYIDDLRTQTGNELITAEQVDLADLFSIRKFATKWIDNAPPRRLDMLILCADEQTPPGSQLGRSRDGAELMMAVNYLANFHLASILSPAIKSQPPDRDVRVLVGTCSSYLAGELGEIAMKDTTEKGSKNKKTATEASLKLDPATFTTGKIYGTTKLALMTFCTAFQKHLASVVRKDGLPSNTRVICIDPGWTRTPGMRRHLTRGSLWGLLIYLITYPIWWLILKSPHQGAQSFLYAAMEAQLSALAESKECVLVKECQVVKFGRGEVQDEETQRKLWETSGKTIESLEKESALIRAKEKAAREKSRLKKDNGREKDANRTSKKVTFADE